MLPKKTGIRVRLNIWTAGSFGMYKALRRVKRALRNAEREWPSEFANFHPAIAACQDQVEDIEGRLMTLIQSDDEVISHFFDTPTLTHPEIVYLRALNRCLIGVTGHLRSVAEDVIPRLEGKLTNADDPMSDDLVETRLDFVLRKDDPDYDDGNDNVIATRTGVLTRSDNFDDLIDVDSPMDEPQCWLFYDLHNADYGVESPAVALTEFKRIGSIRASVQVVQQYVIAEQF